MDKIYLFDRTSKDGGHLFHAVVDKEDGVSIRHNLDKDEVNYTYIDIAEKRRRLTDRLFTIDLVVHKRVINVLKQVCCQSFKTIPTEVRLGGSQKDDNYYCILPDEPVDILNYDMSKVKRIREFVTYVEKWVASRNKLPDYDFFYAMPNSWVVTEKFKKIIESQNITGSCFNEIRIV